jgi:Amt family ammonium transporter
MGYVVLGTMILFVGWFGFNPGSTLNGNDPQIAVIAVNTFLAGIAAGLVAYYIQLVRTGKADIAATCSGIIGGLVAITAPCAFVDYWAAVVIGGIGGALVIFGAAFIEKRLKVDDPVWAIACHGLGGLWGLLALGIFANGEYLDVAGLIAGGTDTFVAQLVSMVTVVAWTGLASVVVFGFIKRTIGLRVSAEDEEAGVDATEFTQPGYVLELSESPR